MPKKPPTNKRAPPKSLASKTSQKERQAPPAPAPAPTAPARPTSHPHPPFAPSTNPYLLDAAGLPIDFASFVPPPSTVDPNDPNFPTALSNWSTTTLGKLNSLPSFSQSQLNAIAEAAVGGAKGGPAGSTAGNLPIDLPASLAALFEAKLTLDREKAKLLRMQKELKAHRETMHGVGSVSNGKGKEVAMDEPCDCGRAHHDEYPASAHSGEHSDGYYCESDEEIECEDGCGCDCHHYHSEDCDCEDCFAEQEEHAHHLHHGHSHSHSHQYYDHGHDHDHGHSHGHNHEQAYIQEIDDSEPPAPQPDIAQQVRNATAQLKSATAEANRASLLAESQQGSKGQGLIDPPPMKSLSQDPDRLDELVRELFNWIKAVVWTIEQAAVVAGRRKEWGTQS